MTESAAQSEAVKDQWTHVCETINMLYLAVCQIEATMADSNESVDTLTHSFTRLATHTQEVSDHIQRLTEVEQLDDFKADIANTAREMNKNIGASVQAFQFYDRVCQRLDHVSRGLEKITRVMSDDQKLHDRNSWLQIQQDIKSSYTMDAERIMFEYIMRGGSVEEALDIYRHHFEHAMADGKDAGNDEIELF